MFDGLDPRTPVLIGAGQLSQRVDRGADVLEPVDLLVEALRRAEVDSGGRGVLARADSVRVARMLSWRYGDPGALVGRARGRQPAPDDVHGHGRQLRPVAGEPLGRRHRRRPGRRGARRRGGGVALADPGEGRGPRAALDHPARRHGPLRVSGRGQVALVALRGGARSLPAGDRLPHVRGRASCRRRPQSRRAAPARRPAVGRLQPGGRHQPPCLDPAGLHGRGDRHPHPGQPDDRLSRTPSS